jgi:hypothetical protein
MGRFTPDEVCQWIYPGFGDCDVPEMGVIAVMFWLLAIATIARMVSVYRASGKRFDQTILFCILVAIWQVYVGLLYSVPFPWTLLTYRLFYFGLRHILLYIPMALVILILFDLLFTYKNPGDDAIMFFRILFIVFFSTFVVTGVIITIVDSTSTGDIEEMVSLWASANEIIIAVFFTLPAISLLRTVTYPLIQPEDVCCVRFCRIGIWAFAALFGGRAIWNLTHYFHCNKLQQWVNDNWGVKGKMGLVRLSDAGFILIFDFVPSLLSVIAVFLFKKHDMMFNENPYYRSQGGM